MIRLFGPVLDVRIIRKNNTGLTFRDSNYGFVHMQNAFEADNAL